MKKWYLFAYFASIITMWLIIAFFGFFVLTENITYINSTLFYTFFFLFVFFSILHFVLFLKQIGKKNFYFFIKENIFSMFINALVYFLLTQLSIIKLNDFLFVTIPFCILAPFLTHSKKTNFAIKYVENHKGTLL